MKELDQKSIDPVYLLHGEEYYFLDQLLDKIDAIVVDESTRSFNVHTFYGKDTDINALLNVCRRFPMMSDYQLVVLKEAQFIKNPELLITYLENPSPTTVLVWYHPGKTLPMNKKPGPAFKKHVIFTADPVAEKEVANVVSTYISDMGYDIEPKPLHLLVENSGAKFSVMVQELQKVFSNVEKGNKIRESHIEQYVGINKEYNIFSLQKALAQRNRERTVEIMHYFSNNLNTHPLPLLIASLFGYFKKVAIMQTMIRSTDKEIMSAIGIPFFAISEFRQAATNYQNYGIANAIKVINECDLKFKGIIENTGDEKELFQETILKILAF
jgi:DNA polymerase-3 subunit delta